MLQGTTQNDIIKEYLSRGTYAFPPAPSLRLIADMVAYTVEHVPKWNPVNICSYHLQEAGATPVQEIAYAFSTAIAVLDEVRQRVPQERMGAVFGRISFFVNAGVRFVEEHAKLRAMGELWDELGRERYGVEDPKHRRFRYGVQVNSLGLTESQPENNVQRIVLEALAVTLGRDARARAIQLPAWNEALGLPRPWDQQWSLRIQQVLAYETDLLEYPDIFEGSKVMEGLVAELKEGAREEMARVAEHGGAVDAVAYMKAALVDSHRERLGRIESGEQVLVGVNRYQETEPSPLTADAEGGIIVVDAGVEQEAIDALGEWRAQRDEAAVTAALEELARVAASDENVMEATIAAARAGATTGEWAQALRDAFGSYRAPTGVGEAAAPVPTEDVAELRDEVARVGEAIGRTPKILVGKPGLDGHSNGAEQIAVRARDIGMDVVYEGIRLTPAQIARSRGRRGRARDRALDPVGLAPLADPRRDRGAARGRRRGDPGRGRRDHPRGRRRAAEGRRRRRGLHAEGLRADAHHARRRRPGRRAQRGLRRRVRRAPLIALIAVGRPGAGRRRHGRAPHAGGRAADRGPPDVWGQERDGGVRVLIGAPRAQAAGAAPAAGLERAQDPPQLLPHAVVAGGLADSRCRDRRTRARSPPRASTSSARRSRRPRVGGPFGSVALLSRQHAAPQRHALPRRLHLAGGGCDRRRRGSPVVRDLLAGATSASAARAWSIRDGEAVHEVPVPTSATTQLRLAGRYLSWVEEDPGDQLVVHDLATGDARSVRRTPLRHRRPRPRCRRHGRLHVLRTIRVRAGSR